MSNVRAEVLRVSRSRTGWKEPEHTKITNQRPGISSLKSTFELSDTPTRSEIAKGNVGGSEMFKPARPGGTKVSTIASMFQSMSPVKDEITQTRSSFQKTESTRTDHSHKKPSDSSDVVTTENLKNSSVRDGGGGGGGGGGGTGTGAVHLARTESHLARFNNARAMFEKLEEKNVTRVKSSCSSLNLKKRSGSVSPSRSSPTRSNFSNCTSRSPSPGEVQSVGSSPKKDCQLSPREKSWSSDNILGVRNRDTSAISKFYDSSHLNGARANMELNLELRESGAGEAIVSPSPLSPGLVNYLIASPLDDDIPTTNGKGGIGDVLIESRSGSFNKPLIPSHKPTINSASFAAKMMKKEVPKKDDSYILSNRGTSQKHGSSNESNHKTNDDSVNFGTGVQLRPRIISTTKSKVVEEKNRSHIPHSQKDGVNALAHEKKDYMKSSESKISDESNFGEQGVAALISAASNSSEIVSTQSTPATPPPPPPLPPPLSLNSQHVKVGNKEERTVISELNNEYDNAPKEQLVTSSKQATNIPAIFDEANSCVPQTVSNGVESQEPFIHQFDDVKFTNGISEFTNKQLLTAEEASYKEYLLEGLQETVVDPDNGSDIVTVNSDGVLEDDVTCFPNLNNWPDSTSPLLSSNIINVKDEELTSPGGDRSSSSATSWSGVAEELPTPDDSSPGLDCTGTENISSHGTSPLSPANFNERVGSNVVHDELNQLTSSSSEEPEVMTMLEAEQLLSSPELLSDEEANEVKILLKMDNENEVKEPPAEVAASDEEPPRSSEGSEDEDDDEHQEGSYEVEEGVNYLNNGHFWVEVPGLPDSDEDSTDCYNAITMPKKRDRVRFSTQPIKVYSTFSVTDYDRRNDDVDPVSASAEYELEKRVEKMDVFPIELMKGSEGLGLSIIGMGVGADAGLEKLGIFVKTITDGGAAHKDGRIKVNDQIIEVDGKSLVGVTQAYAASVLRNTAGLVREKDGENSEVAQLISQSLLADRDREEKRKAIELELHRQRFTDEEESRGECHAGLSLPIPSLALHLQSTSAQVTVQEDSTPEEGEDCPTCEVFDLEDDSSESPSPDSDVTNLRIKLKEAQYKSAVAEADAATTKQKLVILESMQSDRDGKEKRFQQLLDRLHDAEKIVEGTKKEIVTYQDMLEESQGQYILLEKKYYKAKKLIKEFQMREHDLLHREEYHVAQLQEKDQEYNALVKSLKDRVIQLEQDLTDTQKNAGLPVRLPYDSNSIKQLQLTPQQMRKPQFFDNQRRSNAIDISDGECSDSDLTKYDISPISDDAENKTSTVERKPSTKDDVFEKAVPHTELLDNAPAKAKAELAFKGSLANRQPPSLKKTGSTGSSSDGLSQDQRDSESSLNSSHEDLDVANLSNVGDKTSFSTSFSSDSSPAATPLPSAELLSDNQVNETRMASPGSLSHSSPLVGSREDRRSPLRLDDHFAEEMKLILERKTAELKSKVSESDFDNLRSNTGGQLAAESQRNLTPSPGSTTSTHSSDSNAPSTVDLSYSPQHNVNSSAYVKIHGSSFSAKHGAPQCPHSNANAPRGGAQLCYSCCCMPGTARTADSSLISRPFGIDYELRQQHEGKLSYQGEYLAASNLPEKRAHQWHSCSVSDWSSAQVGQWLLALNMEQYITNFMDNSVNGKELLLIDGARLKVLGVISGTDRAVLKKKIKDLKGLVEKERKAVEKEQKTREKLQRKADKAAEKASIKKK